MRFVLVLLIFAPVVKNENAEDFGIDCEDKGEEEEVTIKKTKSWKKCDASNTDLLQCIERGYKAKGKGLKAEENKILCEYIKSDEFQQEYEKQIGEKEQSYLKKWQGGKEFKAEMKKMQEEYVEEQVEVQSVIELNRLTHEFNQQVQDSKRAAKQDIIKLMDRLGRLAGHYAEEVNEKRRRIMVGFETYKKEDRDPVLHEVPSARSWKKSWTMPITTYSPTASYTDYSYDDEQILRNFDIGPF